MVSENEIMAYLKQELGEDLIEASKPRERRVFARIKVTALRKAVNAMKRQYQTLRFMTITTVDHGFRILVPLPCRWSRCNSEE